MRRPRSERDQIASEEALLAYRNARKLAEGAYHPEAYRRASEAYFVAADAFEAEGVSDLAITLRQRARALAKAASPPTRFPVSPERTRRIYEQQRARGKPAAQAFQIAKERQQEARIVGHVGDVNWPAYEGGPILKNADGTYALEYVIPPEEEGRRARYEIYRTDLDKEPLPDWVDASDVAPFIGTSATILRKHWNDRDPRVRAYARVAVAAYYGWHNLDDYPLSLTKKEVQARYRRRA